MKAMPQESGESSIELSAADGLRLHVRRWLTTESSRAVVIVVHGIVEHSGRYADMAAALNQAGMNVWAPDNRGHGRSAGSRVWVDRFDRYAEDLSIVIAEARVSHPNLPLFLFGHSMGSLIVLRTASLLDDKPAGTILSAPPISVADGLFPWLRSLAAFGSRCFPWLRLVRMGGKRLSRDPNVVSDFRSDPLVFHGRIPTRTGAEVLRVGEDVGQRASQITQPLLVLQGTADAVVSASATEEFYQATGSGDKTIRLYPGLYHDLPREPEKEEICREITSWIAQRC